MRIFSRKKSYIYIFFLLLNNSMNLVAMEMTPPPSLSDSKLLSPQELAKLSAILVPIGASSMSSNESGNDENIFFAMMKEGVKIAPSVIKESIKLAPYLAATCVIVIGSYKGYQLAKIGFEYVKDVLKAPGRTKDTNTKVNEVKNKTQTLDNRIQELQNGQKQHDGLLKGFINRAAAFNRQFIMARRQLRRSFNNLQTQVDTKFDSLDTCFNKLEEKFNSFSSEITIANNNLADNLAKHAQEASQQFVNLGQQLESLKKEKQELNQRLIEWNSLSKQECKNLQDKQNQLNEKLDALIEQFSQFGQRFTALEREVGELKKGQIGMEKRLKQAIHDSTQPLRTYVKQLEHKEKIKRGRKNRHNPSTSIPFDLNLPEGSHYFDSMLQIPRNFTMHQTWTAPSRNGRQLAEMSKLSLPGTE